MVVGPYQVLGLLCSNSQGVRPAGSSSSASGWQNSATACLQVILLGMSAVLYLLRKDVSAGTIE